MEQWMEVTVMHELLKEYWDTRNNGGWQEKELGGESESNENKIDIISVQSHKKVWSSFQTTKCHQTVQSKHHGQVWEEKTHKREKTERVDNKEGGKEAREIDQVRANTRKSEIQSKHESGNATVDKNKQFLLFMLRLLPCLQEVNEDRKRSWRKENYKRNFSENTIKINMMTTNEKMRDNCT